MKKIVIKLQPFTMNQPAYVYEDGNKIDAIDTTFDNFDNVILSLTEKYNISEVELIGPAQFSRGIGNKLLKAELEKYNKNNLQISYL